MACCCPAIKSHCEGINGFTFLKSSWRESSLQTQQSVVITIVETVMDTIQHVASKDSLSAFIGPADHFEYTEANVKPDKH